MTKEEAHNLSQNHPIIFYDGVCHLCHGTVNFLIKHDKKNILRFAYLQSSIASKLFDHKIKLEKPDSIYLYYKGNHFTKSTAVLKALYMMGGLWATLYAFYFVPRILRDVVYDYVAEHRYSWFGRHESCLLPSPEIKNKFID